MNVRTRKKFRGLWWPQPIITLSRTFDAFNLHQANGPNNPRFATSDEPF